MLPSRRRRSAVAIASFLVLTAGSLVAPAASADTVRSSVAIVDERGDVVDADTGVAADVPKADIIATSARYQNDHVTFTMKLAAGDDLSDPNSLLWWTIGTDGGSFVVLDQGDDGVARVRVGDPGTRPAAGDTSQDCSGSGASLDASGGIYIASLPVSCITTGSFPSFEWSAGRSAPSGVGTVATDSAPDEGMAHAVTNAMVSGYWALGSDGTVYPFGDAIKDGEAPSSALTMVDVEAGPHGTGYWTLDQAGVVNAFGPIHYGNAPEDLEPNEKAVSLSATPTGAGYWIFTNLGRAIAFGDANQNLGDVSSLDLNGEVLDSSPTPSGNGYYMVAADGGVFALGDAEFEGSMGGIPLNGPVQSIVPDPDGVGYWLVANDGGVFAFEAPFKGSMGDVALNQPMTGMVPFGDGYLMVAEDGGVFNFSTKPFSGSLGDNPPANPVVSIAALA